MIEAESFGSVELIDSMGDDLSIIRAARVSYGKTPGEEFDEQKDGRLMRYLLKNGHWSPFEHTSLTFRVECPIFIARQWMRHRSWSFNEYSARYKEVGDRFYFPHVWRKQSKDNKQMSEGQLNARDSQDADRVVESLLFHAQDTYRHLLQLGVSREQARAFLPVGAYTEFYATASIRSVLHFLEQRLHPHAQQEIRHLAEQVLRDTKQKFPHTILAWEDLRAGQGEPEVKAAGNEGSTPSPSTTEIQERLAFA